eukprot:gnl/TRDRNA2_/TRDRNA2_43729_c0_seq1.p1 gnl/TRDRNA2_/TRDRNA2_43729_c0~~gnl/TRDRNA2_/TRDRNA2_43729_c0_seq1.p1  ORF type:complete len:196 (+),score=26.04 gnl/TRDRNA2_/TRDRNA2_43729_c0_seq1:70-588(+)
MVCVGRDAKEPTADELIKQFNLEPLLPEGGFFRRTHYSDQTVKTADSEQRHASNAILYLMLKKNCSKMHRLKQDETWHFYHGSPMVVVELDSGAKEHHRLHMLGPVTSGHSPQHTVKAGTWFGAFSSGELSLVGCSLGPAFEFEDFELGERQCLLAAYPGAKEVILRLTAES